MEQEHASVRKMWRDYLASIGERIADTGKTYSSWYFCDNKENADDLARLVMEGIKRGTTSLYDLYVSGIDELPREGDYSIITNWEGVAQCIIRTKKVTVLPFENVNEELAKIEGEGDQSLAYWQNAHIYFFKRELQKQGLEFSRDMPVVFEEFEVIYK